MVNNFFARAIYALCPGAQYVAADGAIAQWHSTDIPQPTAEAIAAKVAELEGEYAAQQYARNRSREYPPITDYLDGVVKGDQAQIDAYVAACLAVKAKYPKEQA